jgi:hypothetical protein
MVNIPGDKSSILKQATPVDASDRLRKTWSTPTLRRLDGRSAEAGRPKSSDMAYGTQTS